MLEQELVGQPGDALEVALSVARSLACLDRGAGCKLQGHVLGFRSWKPARHPLVVEGNGEEGSVQGRLV